MVYNDGMKRQPLIIYKSRLGIPIKTQRFKSTVEAIEWLRSEGCKFGNYVFNNIGNKSVLITTRDYEYEIEVEVMGVGVKIRGENNGNCK